MNPMGKATKKHRLDRGVAVLVEDIIGTWLRERRAVHWDAQGTAQTA